MVACADEVLVQCDVSRASDEAPHDPVAGTSTAATSDGKLQVDLSLSADIIASRMMVVFFEYSLLIPVRTKNPREARGALLRLADRGFRSSDGHPNG